jgi:hypothetical protein
MTEATRVHSTPPTNTSATNPAGPVDPTRRRFITVAAGASIISVGSLAAVAMPIAAAPAPDPIYAAIERHKDLAKTYDAVGEGRAHCKDFGTLTEAEQDRVRELNDATDEAHLPLEAAAMDLFNTHPTTRTGIITALFYMRIQHRNDGEHMIKGWLEDEDGERYIDWRDAWLETLTQAVLHLDDAAKVRETRRDRDA